MKCNLLSKISYLYLLFAIALFLHFAYSFFVQLSDIRICKEYEISDWFINYESGFVRRGLMGSILYFMYEKWHINVVYIIYSIIYLSGIIFILLFFKKWRSYRLSLALLPNVFVLGIFVFYKLSELRRDALVFILIYIAFSCYRKMLDGNRFQGILMTLILSLTLLIHEGSFFYVIPILMIHYFLYQKKWAETKYAFKQSVLLFFIPIIVTAFCMLSKGDANMASIIWESWTPFFQEHYNALSCLGDGVAAIGWETLDTFSRHFNANFLTPIGGIPSGIIWPFVLIGIYYLLTDLNKIKIGLNQFGKPFSITIFTHILCLQFIFLMPMYIVLSCDYARVISYWVLSSFIVYFCIGKKKLGVFYHPVLSWKLKRLNSDLHKGWRSKTLFYVIIWLCIGIPFCGFKLEDWIRSSILCSPIYKLYQVTELLKNP